MFKCKPPCRPFSFQGPLNLTLTLTDSYRLVDNTFLTVQCVQNMYTDQTGVLLLLGKSAEPCTEWPSQRVPAQCLQRIWPGWQLQRHA